MASENAHQHGPQQPKSASENTSTAPRARRGRVPARLPEPVADVLDSYMSALAAAPLAEQTRRTYASKVRQYLAWLAGAELDGDPLDSADGRDWAVRDYRAHLQAVLKRKPATVNSALAAVDDFYIRRGVGAASAKRAEIPDAAPRALDHKAEIRYLRAVQGCRSPRDKALALIPFYAGARIAETVALDVDDVRLSARKGILRIYGKGERVREIPLHPELRKALTDWLEERRDWPGAKDAPALFLNQRGYRLSVKGAHDVITGIADRGGLEDHVTAHVLRHSFATTLVRGGTDLVIAAELLGHARLETTRVYTRPTAEDRRKAVSHRARATIATQLYNAKDPMSLFELQAWLGHSNPSSTQHYARITPLTLTKAYTDAGYFARNVRTIEVLLDRDSITNGQAASGGPFEFYDLGHGYCTYTFFEQCPHRMACARCDFYLPKESSRAQLLEAKDGIQRMLVQIPLTDEEQAAVEGDQTAIDRLLAGLADAPTPAGASESRPAGPLRGAGDDDPVGTP